MSALLCLLLVAAPADVVVVPAGDDGLYTVDPLVAAETAYAALDFEQARTAVVVALADPNLSMRDQVRAHLLGGQIAVVLDKDAEARGHFVWALQHDPLARLPLDAPPKTRQFFDGVQAEITTAGAPATAPTVAPPAAPVDEAIAAAMTGSGGAGAVAGAAPSPKTPASSGAPAQRWGLGWAAGCAASVAPSAAASSPLPLSWAPTRSAASWVATASALRSCPCWSRPGSAASFLRPPSSPAAPCIRTRSSTTPSSPSSASPAASSGAASAGSCTGCCCRLRKTRLRRPPIMRTLGPHRDIVPPLRPGHLRLSLRIERIVNLAVSL